MVLKKYFNYIIGYDDVLKTEPEVVLFFLMGAGEDTQPVFNFLKWGVAGSIGRCIHHESETIGCLQQ